MFLYRFWLAKLQSLIVLFLHLYSLYWKQDLKKLPLFKQLMSSYPKYQFTIFLWIKIIYLSSYQLSIITILIILDTISFNLFHCLAYIHLSWPSDRFYFEFLLFFLKVRQLYSCKLILIRIFMAYHYLIVSFIFNFLVWITHLLNI